MKKPASKIGKNTTVVQLQDRKQICQDDLCHWKSTVLFQSAQELVWWWGLGGLSTNTSRICLVQWRRGWTKWWLTNARGRNVYSSHKSLFPSLEGLQILVWTTFQYSRAKQSIWSVLSVYITHATIWTPPEDGTFEEYCPAGRLQENAPQQIREDYDWQDYSSYSATTIGPLQGCAALY